MSRAHAHRDEPWLKCFLPRSHSKVRLIVFPYAGGGAVAFRLWSDALGAEVELHAVTLPGREGRFNETPMTKSREVVEPIATAVASDGDQPFVLFGHSMGSLLAFEVARHLRRSGLPLPAALVASGRCAPQLKDRAPAIGHLPASALVRQVADLYGGIPAAALDDTDVVDLMARILRADLAIVDTYSYVREDPLACPMLALSGLDDPWVTRDELNAWQSQTSAEFAAAQLPGNHFYFRMADGERRLMARLLECCGAVATGATMFNRATG